MDTIYYIADLDQDIDDIIAVEYLMRTVDDIVVICSPYPESNIGIKRLEYIESQNVVVRDDIPEDADIVFCGGALTPVSSFLDRGGRLSVLVINGGFAGGELVEDPLDKFKGKKFVRTYNFNCDPLAADRVLRSTYDDIEEIRLVGKNVCHSSKNTRDGIWKGSIIEDTLDAYGIHPRKRLHDVLMCREGLSFLGMIEEPALCLYGDVKPLTERGLDGNLTKWGSTKPDNPESPYRTVLAAIGWN